LLAHILQIRRAPPAVQVRLAAKNTTALYSRMTIVYTMWNAENVPVTNARFTGSIPSGFGQLSLVSKISPGECQHSWLAGQPSWRAGHIQKCMHDIGQLGVIQMCICRHLQLWQLLACTSWLSRHVPLGRLLGLLAVPLAASNEPLAALNTAILPPCCCRFCDRGWQLCTGHPRRSHAARSRIQWLRFLQYQLAD
jgi:hypothetical protein